MIPGCHFITYLYDTTATPWDQTRAAGVGVQHATEWATRRPKEYVYISTYIVNIRAHFMLQFQLSSFIIKI
jgi:hypothetical protein